MHEVDAALKIAATETSAALSLRDQFSSYSFPNPAR
jgi:hypothetical protein